MNKPKPRLSAADSHLLMAAESSGFTSAQIEETAKLWEARAKRAESPDQREACEKSAARCHHTANLLKGAGR